MTRLAGDQVQLLRALVAHGVEFIVIGGVAAQAHGWRGATVDLDIAISIAEDNVARLNRALARVGASSGTPGALGTTFTTRYGRLEIVRRADAVGDYAGWRRRAAPQRVADDLVVMVANADDVLRSKEAAGRAKDRAVLPQMRRDLVDAGRLAPAQARGPVAAGAADAKRAPAFLAARLGQRPHDASGQIIWDAAADQVLAYRAKYGVTGPDALGDPDGDERQRAHRARAAADLDRAAELLRRRWVG